MRRNAALYGTEHPVSLEVLRALHEFVQWLLSSRPAVRLFIHQDTFFLENTALLEESLQFYSLLTVFNERHINVVKLDQGVELWELKHLIAVLNLKPEEVRRQGAGVFLEESRVNHITVGYVEGIESKIGLGSEAKVDPQHAYRAALGVMDELTYHASMNFSLNLWKARKIVNHFIDIIAEDSAVLLGVTALRDYDEDTYHHSLNVCILALSIGSQLKLDRSLLIPLGLAGLLHDIGKVRVPRELLARAGKLTPEEASVVKRHTLYGAYALRELPGLLRLAMVVAFEHHANYDLSGYPRITVKKVPHLLTRIVQVADVFDAATSSRRAYRRPKRPEEALRAILDGAGTLFDPVLARLSVQVLADPAHKVGRQPPNSQSRR